MIQQPTVFLIEDDEGVRELLALALRCAGLRVAAFASGVAFLEQFDPDQPGCLVCDICMPELTGLEVQFQLIQRGAILPIIFITAFANVADAVCAMKAGAVDYLQKPFTNDALLHGIRCALAKDAEQRKLRLSDAQIKARLATLTPGEREVLDLLIEGHPNKTIATKLDLTYKAVENRRARVMKKIGVKSHPELLRKIIAYFFHAEMLSHPT